MNPYDCVSPFVRLWKTFDKIGYANAHARLHERESRNTEQKADLVSQQKDIETAFEKKTITDAEYNEKAISIAQSFKKNAFVETVIKESKGLFTSPQDKVENVVGKQDAKVLFDQSISVASKKAIVEKFPEQQRVLQQAVNVTYGCAGELAAIKSFEKKLDVSVDTSQDYISKEIAKDVFIGGRLDGTLVKNGTRMVLEVKNRVRGFFKSVRDYENLQIQMYMYLTDTDQAFLLEAFNGKTKTTKIFRNETLITSHVRDLVKFAEKFKTFCNDLEAQEQFVSSRNQEAFLNDLLGDDAVRDDVVRDDAVCDISF